MKKYQESHYSYGSIILGKEYYLNDLLLSVSFLFSSHFLGGTIKIPALKNKTFSTLFLTSRDVFSKNIFLRDRLKFKFAPKPAEKDNQRKSYNFYSSIYFVIHLSK